MERLELASQTEAAFLAMEAREHAECLEAILAFGRVAQMYWAAGCDTNQVRAAIAGTTEVN